MKKNLSTNLAILIFALIIGFFGANQILHADKLVLNAPKSIPLSAAKILVYLSAAGMLLGAVAFIIDRFARPMGYIVAFILMVIVCSVHIPGILTHEGAPRMLYFTNGLKDTAMAMAAIIIGNLSKH